MEENKKELTGRRKWKANARRTVKTHYILLVLLCLIAVFYGTEFSYVTSNANNMYKFVTNAQTKVQEEQLDLENMTFLELAVHLADSYSQENENVLDITKTEQYSRVVTRDRGIFASVANMFTSGKLSQIFVDAGRSIFHSESVGAIILIVLGALLTLCVWVFLKNVYIAVLRRVFLEARTYEHVPISHMLYFRVVRRWARASMTMLLVTIYEILWWFTLIGGVIKHYSYLMVPYIVAENPDVKPEQAIRISRRIMNGHKWEAFKIDVSFLLWHALGYLSFGIIDALWVVPYQTATVSEFYADVRADAKARGVNGAKKLNDVYLFEKADQELLLAAYNDIEDQEEYIEQNQIVLSPVRAFFARNFGIWVGSTAEKRQFDEVDGKRQMILIEIGTIDGLIYPVRLNPHWSIADIKAARSLRAVRTYTIWTIILVFFIFSFVGWGWEVSIHLVKDGIFVNRGVMHGPWLPVYGSGVAMILVILARWRRSPVVETVLTIILCGFVEYMTSYYLEITKGMRWWDYTGYFLNLDGRICGEGLMVFAIGGMAAVYILVPLIDTTFSHLSIKGLKIASLILIIAFTIDTVYSHNHPNIGEGITDYDAYKTGCVEVVDWHYMRVQDT